MCSNLIFVSGNGEDCHENDRHVRLADVGTISCFLGVEPVLSRRYNTAGYLILCFIYGLMGGVGY